MGSSGSLPVISMVISWDHEPFLWGHVYWRLELVKGHNCGDEKNVKHGVPKMAIPQNGWFIMEHPINNGWFGGYLVWGLKPKNMEFIADTIDSC